METRSSLGKRQRDEKEAPVQPPAKRSQQPAKHPKPGYGDLRAIIVNALECHNVSEIYPTAYLSGGQIVVPGVRKSAYKQLCALMPSVPRASRRLLLQYQGERRRLTIKMASPLHEELCNYAVSIKEQIWQSGFLPPEIYTQDDICDSRSTPIKLRHQGRSGEFRPDSGISMFDRSNIFMVLEVAVTLKKRDALEKAQDYILGSGARVRFVMIVKVDRNVVEPEPPMEHIENTNADSDSMSSLTFPPSDYSQSWNQAQIYSALAARENKPLVEQLSKSKNLGPTDRVAVTMFKMDKFDGKPEIRCVIDDVEVYPRRSNASFTISWSDVNDVSWSEVLKSMNSPEDRPAPSCEISLERLSTLAHNNAGKNPPKFFLRTSMTPENVREFIPERSVQPTPSSISVSSSLLGQKTRDSSYEPVSQGRTRRR